MRKYLFVIWLVASVCACQQAPTNKPRTEGVQLTVLGNVQDAGSPQINCFKDCCKNLHVRPDFQRMVSSLGLVDATHQKKYLLDATPDLSRQWYYLQQEGFPSRRPLDGIFLTHAHTGHYTGLMQLGKEAMNAERVPVFAMPRMLQFLKNNGPWSQLVTNENILLQPIFADSSVSLSPQLTITPLLVPHRDEYSETVGYHIIGPEKSALFIPDIDKWHKWNKLIVDEIQKVDYAFLDATFYDAEEINNRDISQIPHPFVIESLQLFSKLPGAEKDKIWFIHFNHTNPLLKAGSVESKKVLDAGFHIAQFGDTFFL